MIGVAPSRFVGCYGLGGATPTYDQFVALYLNIPDVEGVRGFQTFVALVNAQPGGNLPVGWLESAVPNPVEAAKWKMWDTRRSGP